MSNGYSFPSNAIQESSSTDTSFDPSGGGSEFDWGNLFKIGMGLGTGNPMQAIAGMTGMGMGMFGLNQANKFKPTTLNQDFDYGLASSDYTQDQDLSTAIGRMGQLGGEFSQSYRDMLNPGSRYQQNLFQNLRQNVGDTRAQTMGQMNTALASRGVGGMGNIYDAITDRGAGEQYSQGMIGIMNQSADQAAQFGQLATGAYGGMGQLAGGREGRTLQESLANAAGANQYGQWRSEAEYNQAVQNANMRNMLEGQKMGGLMQLGGQLMQPVIESWLS